MASQVGPSDTNCFKVTRRYEDDFPSHVKENIHRRTDQSAGLEYYILDKRKHIYLPFEFIDNHWYQLHIYTGEPFISESGKVLSHTRGTGYWDINDYKHPENRRERYSIQYIPKQAIEAIYFQYSEELHMLKNKLKTNTQDSLESPLHHQLLLLIQEHY
jgi:hypothetical protein